MFRHGRCKLLSWIASAANSSQRPCDRLSKDTPVRSPRRTDSTGNETTTLAIRNTESTREQYDDLALPVEIMDSQAVVKKDSGVAKVGCCRSSSRLVLASSTPEPPYVRPSFVTRIAADWFLTVGSHQRRNHRGLSIKKNRLRLLPRSSQDSLPS